MAKFTKADRQRIIDGYLADSGANMFVPAEFIDWLSGEKEHEAYGWFFGRTDAEMAREQRVWMARQMASGLRIVANVSEAPGKGSVVSVKVREFPAFVSPVAGRKSGGGYEPFDPRDAASVSELQRQGASALRSWLRRYGGLLDMMGVERAPIEEIASDLEGRVALSA